MIYLRLLPAADDLTTSKSIEGPAHGGKKMLRLKYIFKAQIIMTKFVI